jgi:hypothetical protein
MADTTLADALLLITKVTSTTNKRLSLLEKVTGKKASAQSQGTDSKKPRQVVQKAAPVIVTDFGKKAEQDLGRLGGDPGQGGAGGEGGKGAGGVSKLLGGALLVLGGLAALVQGLMTDGPLKGLLKILAKGGIIGGIKLFASTAAKSLKGFGKQFAKIMPKNLFKNVITAAKGFLGSIGKFLLKPFAKIAGKGGGKALFGTIGKLFMKFLKPVLKRIPGIGSLISWGFAISRFKSGDLVGGLIDVASGIATLFPGIGTGIGIGLDVLNAFLDTKKGNEEVKPEGAPGGIGAFFGKIKDKVMNSFPIKNLVEFYSGVGKVFTGNFKEGFHQMAMALPFMKPLANFLFSEKEEVDPDTGEVTKKKSLISAVKDSVVAKLKAGYAKMPKWLKWGMEKVLPENIIKMLSGGEMVDDGSDDMGSEPEAAVSTNKKKGSRKDGGPVSAGAEYLVGEEGPELFVPEKNGNIIDNKSTMEALGSGAIVKASVEGNNLIKSLRDANNNLLETQIGLLQESTTLLREIAEKTGMAGNNIITNTNNSVTNMNSQRSLRDLQEVYS